MRRCAGVVIRNAQGKYLLQMRDDTPGIVAPLTWDFFGGGIQEGEEPMNAAIREMREELDLSDEGGLEPAFRGKIGAVEGHLFMLRRTVEWGEFRVLEGAGAGFFTPQEALQLQTNSLVKEYFVLLC